MASLSTSPLESILRLCSAAEPSPWYPREYCQQQGMPREALDPSLDQLRLSSLIELTDWVAGHGQGYRITPRGKSVLADPRALALLNRGQIPPPPREVEEAPADEHSAWLDRVRKVRDAIRGQQTPFVTWTLMLLNAAVFLWGLALAQQAHVAGDFLKGFLGGHAQNYVPILYRTGAASLEDVLHGQWWRLLTACFVHMGLLHIAANCWALYILGPLCERMYGRWRVLLVYLVACFGGSALGIFVQPGLLAGASGAICGLLGALAAWAWLNRRYIPPEIRSSWNGWIIQNIVLVGALSLIPGVSWSGHLGGAIFGLFAGALMSVNRFGARSLRLPTLVGTCILVVVAIFGLKPAAMATGKWQTWRNNPVITQDEVESFNKNVCAPVNEIFKSVDEEDKDSQRELLLNRAPMRRKAKDVKEAIDGLKTMVEQLKQAAKVVDDHNDFQSRRVNKAREALLQLIDARIAYYERCRTALENPQDETDDQQLAELLQNVGKAMKNWNSAAAGD